jgi:hypothetical protein
VGSNPVLLSTFINLVKYGIESSCPKELSDRFESTGFRPLNMGHSKAQYLDNWVHVCNYNYDLRTEINMVRYIISRYPRDVKDS